MDLDRKEKQKPRSNAEMRASLRLASAGKCVQCHIGAALVDNYCQQCFEMVVVGRLDKEAERLRNMLAAVDFNRIQQKARLNTALQALRAPDPKCHHCGFTFSSHMEYAVHFPDCDGKKPARQPRPAPVRHRTNIITDY